MPSDIIQWFPGHMAKTRRLIAENLKDVDILIEILDARIPYSSRNPEIKKLKERKPTVMLLNKASLADPEQSARWQKYYTNEETVCLLTDCATGNGLNRLSPAIHDILHEKVERYEAKGMSGRRLKAMIVGIPNVGKSSLINRITGTKKVKVENRPGVTLNKQWVSTNIGIDLMDMPGVLWPKFEDQTVGENLAITGAIRSEILDMETIATALCARMLALYPDMLSARYKMGDLSKYHDLPPYDLFLAIGRKRGFLISGGEVNTERTAAMLLEEFRAAKIGRMTLDRCPE